jgi:hypothetical protein
MLRKPFVKSLHLLPKVRVRGVLGRGPANTIYHFCTCRALLQPKPCFIFYVLFLTCARSFSKPESFQKICGIPGIVTTSRNFCRSNFQLSRTPTIFKMFCFSQHVFFQVTDPSPMIQHQKKKPFWGFFNFSCLVAKPNTIFHLPIRGL